MSFGRLSGHADLSEPLLIAYMQTHKRAHLLFNLIGALYVLFQNSIPSFENNGNQDKLLMMQADQDPLFFPSTG